MQSRYGWKYSLATIKRMFNLIGLHYAKTGAHVNYTETVEIRAARQAFLEAKDFFGDDAVYMYTDESFCHMDHVRWCT